MAVVQYGELHSTLLDGAPALGVSSLAFDNELELLWVGNSGGHLTSYCGARLQKHTSFQIHRSNPVLQVDTFKDRVLGVTKDCVTCHSKYGIKEYEFIPKAGHLFSSSALWKETNLFIGTNSPALYRVDLNTCEYRIEDLTEEGRTGCEISTVRSSPDFIYCGSSDGRVTVRDTAKLKAQYVFNAHTGPVIDMDLQGNQIVTCGYPLHRGSEAEGFVKVFDIRMMLPITMGLVHLLPGYVRFISNSSWPLIIVSQSGQFQIQGQFFIDPSSPIYQFNNVCGNIKCFTVSPTTQVLAFGDDNGHLQLLSRTENPIFHYRHKMPDFPMPPKPQEQVFSPNGYDVSPLTFSMPPTPLGQVISPGSYDVSSPPFSMPSTLLGQANSISDCNTSQPPFSVFPTPLGQTVSTGNYNVSPQTVPLPQTPQGQIIPSGDHNVPPPTFAMPPAPQGQIISSCDYSVSLPTFPMTTTPQGQVLSPDVYNASLSFPTLYHCEQPTPCWQDQHWISVSQLNPLTDPRSAQGGNSFTINPGKGPSNKHTFCQDKLQRNSAIPETPIGKGSPVTSTEHLNFSMKYSRFCYEDCYAQDLNKTRFTALDPNIANSYCNCMLQMLYFLRPLRLSLPKCLNTEKEYNLTEELGLFFKAQDACKSGITRASNFLFAFQRTPHAKALGLVQNYFDPRQIGTPTQRDLCQLIQSWHRFMIQQLHTELGASKTESGTTIAFNSGISGKGSDKNLQRTAVEKIFGTEMLVRTCFANGNVEQKRKMSFMFTLRYPFLPPSKLAVEVAFTDILFRSICPVVRSQSWDSSTSTYQPMVQTYMPTSLPEVLALNCGLAEADEKEFWEVQTVLAETWVPLALKIILLKSGGLKIFDYKKRSETHEPGDIAEQRIYDLYATVCHILNTNSGGNLVAHIKVAKQYHQLKKNESHFQWFLVNDFHICPTTAQEAVDFDLRWKVPAVIYYVRRGSG